MNKVWELFCLKVGIFRTGFTLALVTMRNGIISIKLGRKKGSTVAKLQVRDITRVNFGYYSDAYTKYGKLIKEEHYPWQFITIHTINGVHHLYSKSDKALECWYVGINRLIEGHCFSATVTDHRSMLRARTQMKLFYYTRDNGITIYKLWHNAIKKTIVELDRPN